MRPDQHLVIVGAGFSGTLLAINLLRFGGSPATLVERRGGQMGRGVAYSATDPGQLLNVRASGMSAFPDDPGHFARWVEARGCGGATDFVPRELYGAYLAETLAAERQGREGRLRLIEAEATDIFDEGDQLRVTLAAADALRADVVVLATGNMPPHPPPGIDPARLPAERYIADPWRADLARDLGEGHTVVLLGTGLTAIDAALQLDAAGFDGEVLALSRRGLRPRAHIVGQTAGPGLADPPAAPLSSLVQEFRQRSEELGWRAAVDAYRPVTQRLWGISDATKRARFLRHLRPFWDVHRHRLAPAVAARIDGMVTAGRLRFAAGKIAASGPAPGGIRLSWRPRGQDRAVETLAARVVNCTGPQGDLTRTDEPLLCALIARGAIRPDPLRLGLEVDAQSQAVRADGAIDARLCCIGPMTRGGLWEVVAVPDIRRQTWDVARRLSNAQWVGGEGL
ncbi:FAD/NAD(P)-binding protein [uncultured Sphingomonas sp.]|uniref:FAD/NAD(P)-binding protein n=1 Tax=uncultured Sphingomonas sp. TaxID=158754 RepID=UPI0035CCA09E